MGLTVSHALSATTPDDPGYEIQPKHWNSGHLFTLNAVGSEISGAFGNGGGVTFGLSADGKITASAPAAGGGITNINVSAGTTSNNLSAFQFSNANGVSFGLNGSTVTATVRTDWLSTQSNQAFSAAGGASAFQTLSFSNGGGVSFTNTNGQVGASVATTYRASNDGVGLNTALTAGPLAWTVNSNGISLNASSAAGTTSGFGGNLISGSMTHNTAGLNLSLNHPAWLTTARASNDAIGLNTAQSNVTWTVNSAGLSLDGRGYAGTGTSATNASITLNSNGLAISVGAGGGTTNQTGPNIADGGGNTITSGTVVFSNSNGVSFGLNGSTMTGSVDAVAVAAGGATASSGIVVFSNSNNITFGLNGQTMTASYGDPVESVFWRPNDLITTVGAPINASASVMYCPLDHNLSASRFDLIASVNVATAANNSSAGLLYSITAAIYTKNGGTLSSLSSTTTNNQMTWSSNATGSVTGAFFMSLPLNVNAVADKYWVAVQVSTRATGLTGAATTSLANTVSMMGVGSAMLGAFSAREPGANTANSNGWFYGMGMYSGTSNFSTIGFTNLTQQGTNMNRANLALRMVNV